LRGLSVVLKPLEERLAAILRRRRSERHQGAANGQLVAESQTVRAKKCGSSVERSGEGGRSNLRCASSRFKERQVLIPANLVLDSRTAIEIEQIGAAAEQHMLAIIDYLAGAGMLIRRGPSAKIRTALKERYAKASLCQGAPGGETG